MTLRCRAIAAMLVTSAATLPAQQTKGATIAGVVQDSLAQPVPGAEVAVRPSGRRMRTDSLGRFFFTGLDGGSYTITARRVGYRPDEWDAKLTKNGRVDIKLKLVRRVDLDTVRVVATRECSTRHLDGFFCRQRKPGGIFLDFPDIDEKNVLYTADIFRDIPGFRVDLRRSRNGPVRVPVRSNGYGCITSIVDGMPTSPANPVPTYPGDVTAMEIYLHADSVPKEYQRYTWPPGGVARSGRCSVVIYWTFRADFAK
jgi:hypothetical protein